MPIPRRLSSPLSRAPLKIRVGALVIACLPWWIASGQAAEVGLSAAMADLASLNRLVGSSESEPVFRSRTVDVGGLEYHFVEGGRGPTVVFLHGFPSYWFIWREQLRHLVSDHRVIAPDLLGANLTAKPAGIEPYRIDNLVAQLHAFITALAPDEPVVLIGHDWGGALTWAYAQSHPESLSRVVVLSAPPLNLFLDLLRADADQQLASAYVERLKAWDVEGETAAVAGLRMWQLAYGPLMERQHLGAEEAEFFSRALRRPGALSGGIKWYQANVPRPAEIEDDDFWPTRTAKTDLPSLLIWGESDRTFVPAFLDRLPTYAPQVRIERLPDVGHWPGIEAAPEVNRLIRDFLQ